MAQSYREPSEPGLAGRCDGSTDQAEVGLICLTGERADGPAVLPGIDQGHESLATEHAVNGGQLDGRPAGKFIR